MLPLQAGISAIGGSGAAGAGGAAAAANPIAAAILLTAAATAYGTSPTFREKANQFGHNQWENLSNPFQHFGDGSDKDRFGQLMNGQLDMNKGLTPFNGPANPDENSGLNNMIAKALGGMGQQDQQKKTQSQQSQLGYGTNGTDITAPSPSPYLQSSYQYLPPSPINPIPPLFGQQEKGVSLYGGIV